VHPVRGKPVGCPFQRHQPHVPREARTDQAGAFGDMTPASVPPTRVDFARCWLDRRFAWEDNLSCQFVCIPPCAIALPFVDTTFDPVSFEGDGPVGPSRVMNCENGHVLSTPLLPPLVGATRVARADWTKAKWIHCVGCHRAMNFDRFTCSVCQLIASDCVCPVMAGRLRSSRLPDAGDTVYALCPLGNEIAFASKYLQRQPSGWSKVKCNACSTSHRVSTLRCRACSRSSPECSCSCLQSQVVSEAIVVPLDVDACPPDSRSAHQAASVGAPLPEGSGRRPLAAGPSLLRSLLLTFLFHPVSFPVT